ncbi:MAG: hypothetical protein LAQ69_25905 [Acidobacteriia bacterium]|nr:hypothetical protein [Terriglobia bacterium]
MTSPFGGVAGKLKRALPACALVVTLALTPMGCKTRKVAEQQTVEEPPPSLASIVHVGDPKAAGQLLSGFHEIENHAWRWSMRQFSVVLRPPPGSAQRGAILTLKLTLPAVVLQTEKTISLSASIDGHPLPAETWSQPGAFVYQRDVPATLLTGDAVRILFVLDKALPPGEKDARELGVVVSTVGLELK